MKFEISQQYYDVVVYVSTIERAVIRAGFNNIMI